MYEQYFAFLAHPDNVLLDASIFVDSSSSVYPVSRLNSLPVSETWRSANSIEPQEIEIDLGSAQAVSVLALVNHNLTSAAVITVDAGTSTSYSEFSTTMDWRELIAFKLLTATQTYRYWRITIADSTNDDGFVEVGYMIMGEATQPDFTFRHGWRSSTEFQTAEVITEFGTTYVEELFRRQSMSFQFGPLATSDMAVIRTLYKTCKRNVHPFLLLPERAGTDVWFGRIDTMFEERVEIYRYVDLTFLEDSFGHSIAA